MMLRLAVSTAIAIALLSTILVAASHFFLGDSTDIEGQGSVYFPDAPPIDSSPEASPIPRKAKPVPIQMRGRFLAAFETWHFQPDGSDKWLWVDDKTGSLNDLYQKLVAEPRRQAGMYGWKPGTMLRDHLCLSVELTGHVEHDLGAFFDRLVVSKVRSPEVLELDDQDCLHTKAAA
jgi:hypothetical protein